jgi:hypothetical protein
MDELDRLADAYRARASASVKSKLDVLMKLEGGSGCASRAVSADGIEGST